MTRDDQIQFVDEARKAADAVESEADLSYWDALFSDAEEYWCLSDDSRKEIDAMYASALRKLWGIDY